MNNPNKDDFERMVQLAEFGARRHDERRQVEFRVFIAYNTLLVLAFYQLKKIEDLGEPGWVTLGLILIHIIYLLWQIRLSMALVNDARRRNFDLKKAECISDHLWKYPNVPFHPGKEVCVTISPDSVMDKKSKCKEKGKIYESELFDRHEPYITLSPGMLEFWKHWNQIYQDWSRPFQTVIPTVMLILLIGKLVGTFWTVTISLIFVFVIFIFIFSEVILSRKRRNYS